MGAMKRMLMAATDRYYQEYLEKGLDPDEAWRLAELAAIEGYEAACEAKMDAKREEGWR